MTSAAVMVISGIQPPEVPGIYYRLLCMTGPGKGQSYYLNSQRAVIGRGSECDIEVDDTKASREHAELVRIGTNYIITDLGSQNGLIVNDLNVKQHNLVDGDRVVIGKTMFKYSTVTVDEKNVSLTADEEENYSPAGKPKPTNNRKGLYLIIGGLIVLFFMIGEKDNTVTKNEEKPLIKAENNNFNDYINRKNTDEDGQVSDRLDAIVHRGLRESREKNYFRAIEEFNLALILSPNNARAGFYLRRTKQRLDEEITENFNKAAQEIDALKFKSAIISYCSVVRLLQNYPTDDRHKEAILKIRAVESKIGMKENEVTCFEKQ